MELSTAKNLIQKGIHQELASQLWADLGAGEGLFSNALAELLPTDSKIISIDKDERALKGISVKKPGVQIQKLVADLNHLPELPHFDGILMANTLHYIQNQIVFLSKLGSENLKRSGVIILVEYNLDKSNPWVPFPISKNRLVSLAEQSGFELEIFPGSVKSKLNSSEIYSAGLKPKA